MPNSVQTADRLETILRAKREEVERARAAADLRALEQAARSHAQGRRPFAAALERPGRAIIAEMKRASPSRGLLRKDYDPASLSAAYHRAGARALSVLTDGPFFGGSLGHLVAAHAAAPLPVLRKDFVLDEFQVLESAAAGADAVLLIVAAFPPEGRDTALRRLLGSAAAWGMDALVEVHDERELDRALGAGARLIGVNNRDLRTFAVNVETSLRLAPRIREKIRNIIAVSESGLGSAEDLARLEAAGYRAFLIGEHLVTAGDPGAALEALLGQHV